MPKSNYLMNKGRRYYNISLSLERSIVGFKMTKSSSYTACLKLCKFFFFFFFWSFFRAAPMAYGGSHARGLIRAVAAGLCQSHSNTRSEPQLTPQLMAMPSP